MNNLNQIKKDKKNRDFINRAKYRFIDEHKKISNMLVFHTDFNMSEDDLKNWYKDQLKLDAILKKYKLNKP